MFDFTATYTDLYQLTMGQVYHRSGRADEHAVFDYYFRKMPFQGGFVVFSGLEAFINIIRNLHFSTRDLQFLRDHGFDENYLEFLKSFRFRGSVYSCPEGDLIFPTRPVLRIEGGLLETQLVETLLLNMLNFQSLIATKAARIRLAAGKKMLSEYGLRRAQATGGYYASRAAVVGGMDSTSNVRAAIDFDLQASGTMAHSFIQGYEDELSAFRDYASVYPDTAVLLVDTYNTLESGVPNAITIGKELAENGHKLKGVRLDSGDLAYLAKKTRQMLDNAGLQEVKIIASNQLDEFVIRSLIQQEAPIDVFGVGTSLATGFPDAALDGVYKLAFTGGKPRIKLSESIRKLTLPDRKQVFRMINGDGFFAGAEVVGLENEGIPGRMIDPFEPHKRLDLSAYKAEPLLVPVMDRGEVIEEIPTLQESAAYCRNQLARLPDEYKRFDNPHMYKIGISQQLLDLRTELTTNYRKK